MTPTTTQQADTIRARRTALALLGLLAIVLITYVAVGFDPVVLYGLLGGLGGCLLVVGLDRLHALRSTIQSQSDRPQS